MSHIPYATSYVTQADKDAVMGVLDRNYFTRGGEMQKFEERLSEVSGKKYAVTFCNATVALWATLRAIGIRSYVYTPTLTYAAILNAARLNEYFVQYADVDRETLCVSGFNPVGVGGALAPMDYAGYPSLDDFPALNSSQTRRFVLLDAAHSFGAMLSDGKSNTSRADAAVYSFHPAKLVCSGEGGAVVTDHEYLAVRLREIRNNGFKAGTFQRAREGLNLHLDEMSCALGYSQSKRIGESLAIRRMIAQTYYVHWRGDERLTLPAYHPGHAYHLFVIRLAESVKIGVDEFRAELAQMGVGSQRHYIPLHQLDLDSSQDDLDCPVAVAAYNRTLSIPMYVGLTAEQQQKVMDSIDWLLDKYDRD